MLTEALFDAFEIEAGYRAVLRDVNQLMDLFDTPIEDDGFYKGTEMKYSLEYDARNAYKGYHIIDRPLTYTDAQFLIECINTSKSISDKTAEKLKEVVASQRSSFEKARLLDSEGIYTVGRSHTDNEKILRILKTINEAIKHNHKISYRYKNYAFN